MVLPTDNGVMERADMMQARMQQQNNSAAVQTGMNVGSLAGRAVQQALQVADFKERAMVNRSRLATEGLRRQELKLQMEQYKEELGLRQIRAQTMQMELGLKQQEIAFQKQHIGDEGARADAKAYGGRVFWDQQGNARTYDPVQKKMIAIPKKTAELMLPRRSSALSLEERLKVAEVENQNELGQIKARADARRKLARDKGEIVQDVNDTKAGLKAAAEQRKAQRDAMNKLDSSIVEDDKLISGLITDIGKPAYSPEQKAAKALAQEQLDKIIKRRDEKQMRYDVMKNPAQAQPTQGTGAPKDIKTQVDDMLKNAQGILKALQGAKK